jgi:membrane-bound lytic murein transglycosylase D
MARASPPVSEAIGGGGIPTGGTFRENAGEVQLSQSLKATDPAITASWTTSAGEHRSRLTAAFCVGCDAAGELQVEDEKITRVFVAVFRREGQWWVRDLGSPDGMLVNGAPLQSAPISRRSAVSFGNSGSHVLLEPENPSLTSAHGVPAPVAGAAGDERTRLHSSGQSRPSASATVSAPPVSVRTARDTAPREFTGRILLGRDAACSIRIDDDGVSRQHAEIYPVGGQWRVRDLGSSNGTWLDGERIEETILPGRCTLRLGQEGPRIEITHAAPAAATEKPSAPGTAAPKSVEEIAAHYFDPNSKAPAGDRTMWVRQAFRTVQRKQKRRYGSVIAGAVALLLVAVGVGIFQHQRLQKTQGIAEQLFYSMKTVELQLVRLEDQVRASGDTTHDGELQSGRAKLAEMASQYDSLLAELGVLNERTSPEDRLILRMAREFGECEIAMPAEFVEEVHRYIGIWRSNQRLAKALERARRQNLPPVILETLTEHRMPAQFFYVALQESDFQAQAVGPETRFGIAKGLWQLMPETAIHYGLRTGPLLDVPQYDPEDQRFDAEAATRAAARYLADLYRDEAQASGLLVLASYNWGTTRVRNRIRAMKENPRDRNFWRLLAQTDMPKETRDYVFLIFAAAVIGEDPQLFGFDFERPLPAPAAQAQGE